MHCHIWLPTVTVSTCLLMRMYTSLGGKICKDFQLTLSHDVFKIYGVFNDGDSTEYLIFLTSYKNCKQHKNVTNQN